MEEYHCWSYLLRNCTASHVTVRVLVQKKQGGYCFALLVVFEPHREKTGFLPMRKQRRRSASQ